MRESDEFAAVLEDMFTSHDGFIPYYPNKPDAGVWLKPVEEWDHNQLQALIRAYVIKEVNANGTTVLLVEQNARAALKITSRGYVIEQGATTMTGTGAETAGLG